MKELIYYNYFAFEKEDISKFPGMEKFLYFLKIYSYPPIFDRTDTIKLPISVRSIYSIPKFQVFTKTFEEVCDDRAREVLDYSERKKKKIYIFYSGGIDSTLVMVSLLKNASKSQKKNMIVLLSDHSINENPKFYNDYIGGKLSVESSLNFSYRLGEDSIFLTGEHNDHLFGSVWVKDLMETYGNDIVSKPYDTNLLVDFFNMKEDNAEMNKFWVGKFQEIVKKSPVQIVNFFDFFWWIGFALRWQGFVMYPLLSIVCKTSDRVVSEEYFKNNYLTFFGTDDFQLWSMNNMDKKIKDTWKSYKWICKDIIYEYTKDADYRDNKIKIASMKNIIPNIDGKNFLDTGFNLYTDLSLSEIYLKDNDFK